MKLPGNAVGISDILAYRDCPARFAYGMRRHIELPPHLQIEPGERDDPPESTNWTNVYGSAIHEAISEVERGASHETAIDAALQRYGVWLTPEDIELLGEDLQVYEQRRPARDDVELVAAERDMRVPLFVTDDGEQMYFRFKLDVLYRLKDHPDVFISRDYKSSAHAKSEAEVHKDPQQWSYNFGIHELFPECRQLFQEYDQLKFGVRKTSKNAQQRAEMKQWLIAMVKVILADERYKPKRNEWCRWCPMVVTCRETKRATEFERGKLALLAPLVKEGRKIKVAFWDEGEHLEGLIRDELPRMIEVRKHIAKVEETLKGIIEEMALEERERLGWLVRERTSRRITTEGLRELHELLGDSFYELVSLPVSRLEEFVGKPKKGEPVPAELELARQWMVEEPGGVTIVPRSAE